jgi:hypothetical protein
MKVIFKPKPEPWERPMREARSAPGRENPTLLAGLRCASERVGLPLFKKAANVAGEALTRLLIPCPLRALS